ncbi:MAG: hypothetical protein JNM74_21550, partial [Myxococcales bacterium]|nr:hypothetical protein [Myxococcales bacterium]
MSTKRTTLCAALTAAVATFAVARDAHATGFAELGEDIVQRDKVTVELDGYLRTRGEALHNFDLDRGLSPS